jgi:Tfp pilus assembly ATPase PilU
MDKTSNKIKEVPDMNLAAFLGRYAVIGLITWAIYAVATIAHVCIVFRNDDEAVQMMDKIITEMPERQPKQWWPIKSLVVNTIVEFIIWPYGVALSIVLYIIAVKRTFDWIEERDREN